MKNLLLIFIIFLMPLACLGQQKCFSDSLNVTQKKEFWGLLKYNRYHFRGIELYGWQKRDVLYTFGDSITKQYYHKSIVNDSYSTMSSIGILSVVISGIPLTFKFTPGHENDPAYFTQKQVKNLHRIGATMLVGGVTCIVTGVTLRKKSKMQHKKAIESYNTHIGRQEKKMSYWELKQEGAGAGLVYHF